MESRIRLIQGLRNASRFPLLPSRVVRLYLLLVVLARRIGRPDVIPWSVLQRVLGHSLSLQKVGRIARVLEDQGLARLSCPPLRGGPPRRRIVVFTVFPARGRRSANSGQGYRTGGRRSPHGVSTPDR